MDQNNTQESENMAGPGSPCSAWLGRAERAEAEVERLRTALRFATAECWYCGGRTDTGHSAVCFAYDEWPPNPIPPEDRKAADQAP